MVRYKEILMGAAILLGAAGLSSAANAASLYVVDDPDPVLIGDSDAVIAAPPAEVVVYDSDRYGPRYRHRHGQYTYYHNGWYYGTPWWAAPLTIPGAVVGGLFGGPVYGDTDPERSPYCVSHRDWDPTTKTFWGLDGRRHRCIM